MELGKETHWIFSRKVLKDWLNITDLKKQSIYHLINIWNKLFKILTSKFKMFIGYLYMYGRKRGYNTTTYELQFIYITCGFS